MTASNDVAPAFRASATATSTVGKTTSSGWPPGSSDVENGKTLRLGRDSPKAIGLRLAELYSENVTAKVLGAAVDCLVNNQPITAYPEYVPQVGPDAGKYLCREASFWTCGFFPGSIYALLERAVKHPGAMSSGAGATQTPNSAVIERLRELGATWSQPIHAMAERTDTHDMSFMVQPSMRRRWELLGDEAARDSVLTAARSLFKRYDATVGAIRSWDALRQDSVSITSLSDDFLVIIDSMVNLDLLYFAAAHTGQAEDQHLAAAATQHARTVLRHHLRREEAARREGYAGPLFSSFHVANFSPASGEVKSLHTAQGYARDSTWARGQAWGILGFAQTYLWTRDAEFLEAACGLAEYFLLRLETAPPCVEVEVETGVCGRYVPLWDFDAPVDEQAPLRDSSAGMVAANGMLVLAQALTGSGQHALGRRYLDAAVTIAEDVLALSLSRDKAVLEVQGGRVTGARPAEAGRPAFFQAVLRNSTANYNARDFQRYWDHGLVYADYYLIEFGNRLLQMGYV